MNASISEAIAKKQKKTSTTKSNQFFIHSRIKKKKKMASVINIYAFELFDNLKRDNIDSNQNGEKHLFIINNIM